MGATFSITPSQLFKGFDRSINNSIEKGLDKGSMFMAKQFDLVFENEGFKNVNRRGFGFQMFKPTTMAAKKKRKSFPRGGGKTGKKGFTQQQARYLFAAPSLEDTGRLRSSLAIEKDNLPNLFRRFVGAGVAYIKSTEEGSTITVDGKSFDVPSRSFQYITGQEIMHLLKIMRGAISG